MIPAVAGPALLAGPPLDGRPEDLASHLARLGPSPELRGFALIEALEASGHFGRGGAGFPVGRKWRCLAERRSGPAVVVVNGAEGEPLSAKDRALMTHRPHLVLDGAALAAEAIGADEIVVYVGSEHRAAARAMAAAIAERSALDGSPGAPPSRIVLAPPTYIAGEATAAVHCINGGDARPLGSPRASERGVGGRPTLVQNVESLAWAALIGRHGPDWYRALGRAGVPGAALVTLAGDVSGRGVREIALGTTLRELLDDVGEAAAPAAAPAGAVILGGYFGTWTRISTVIDLPLDPLFLGSAGLTFGCGLVGLLAEDRCGLAVTARMVRFLADQSARQCGPCEWGLRSMAEASTALAAGRAGRDTAARLEGWASLVSGRGACHHPDGAAQLLVSALEVFAPDVAVHARGGACLATRERPSVAA